ncbi:MAG: SDR family oxidoreductase [Proteobacteria bacterium]|nr:SDR family oxidoreductase [Pseudomonadota bacterium]
MNIEFADRRVIVTGAGHGFGRAIAHGFAQRGARVWASDVNTEALAVTLRDAPKSKSGSLTVHRVDVTDRAGVAHFVAEAEKAGPVHILVNDAGGVCGQVGKPMEEVAPAEWQVIFDVNVTGAFNLSQSVVPKMKTARYGRIVNISSGAGLGISKTGIQAYASAKAGQIGLTRQLAHELGPFGITVNSVAPGFVRSNPSTEKQWEAYGPEGQRRLVEGIALQRLGTPADIANAVMFFASDYAGWISGQVLSVDGGK